MPSLGSGTRTGHLQKSVMMLIKRYLSGTERHQVLFSPAHYPGHRCIPAANYVLSHRLSGTFHLYSILLFTIRFLQLFLELFIYINFLFY